MKPSAKDLRRLKAIAEKIKRDEAYFQGRHGDPRPDSVRIGLMEDAAALLRVVDCVSGEGA